MDKTFTKLKILKLTVAFCIMALFVSCGTGGLEGTYYEGMIWIFDKLVDTSIISKKTAANKLKQLVAAGDADAPVRWNSCRLDFSLLFYQEKRRENCYFCAVNYYTSINYIKNEETIIIKY